MWQQISVLQLVIFFFVHISTSYASTDDPPLMKALGQVSSEKKTNCYSGNIRISSRHKKNGAIIDLQWCDKQLDSIILELPKILSDSPNCFVLVIRSNTTDKNFETRMRDVLEQEASRPMVVNFYNRIKRTETFYVIDRSTERTRMKTNKTLEYAKDFIDRILSLDYDVDRYEFIDNRSELIKEAMRNECALCISMADLIDYRYNWYLKIHEEEINELKCDTDCFKALLSLPYDFGFNSTYDELYGFVFKYYIELLRDSISSSIGDKYKLDQFLKDNAEVRIDLEGLAALAWKEEEYQVFEFLIRLDLPFPQNFLNDRRNKLRYSDKNIYLKNVAQYIDELDSFHRQIQKGNLKRVELFLEQNSHLTFARNLDNKSALKAAFDNNQMEVFAYLMAKGMSFMSIKEIGEYYKVKNKYKDNKRKQLRQFNMKFLTRAVDVDLITRLMQKSTFTFDHHVHSENVIQETIRKAYETIESTTREILEIAAASNELQVIFDFTNSDLIEFDPYSSDAHGAAYNYYDFVIVAAKDLLSDDLDKKNYALGTLGHELFHYTIHQIYQNNINPYDEKDYERKAVFSEIYEKYREIKDEDNLISTAYKEGYDEHNYGELAARVPDILFTYKDNETYLEEVKETFKDLFKFYDQYILADMLEIIPTMQTREKVREINNWLDLAAEIESYDFENTADTETDDDAEEDVDEDTENKIDEKKKEEKIEEDEEELPEVIAIEEFLKDDTAQRLKVFTSPNPKLILQKLFYKLRKSRTLAIYVASSFSYFGNFEQVMYKIDMIHPSVPLIVNCDRVKKLKSFTKMMQKTTFRKVVAIADEEEMKKKVKTKTLKEWIDETEY